MLARVASNLYWINRYLQRVENMARLIRVHGSLLMDLPAEGNGASWLPLVSVTGADKKFAELHSEINEHTVCHFLIADERNPGSIRNNLQAVHNTLRASRDSMSTRLYETIRDLSTKAIDRAASMSSSQARHELLNYIELQSLTIAGAMETTISRDTGYLFMHAGGMLERADMTSRILDVRSANLLPFDSAAATQERYLPYENLQWASVLRSMAAFQMYMKKVKKPVLGDDVLRFLLQDRKLPHAFHHCLTELATCIRTIDAEQTPVPQLDKLIDTVQNANVPMLARNKQQLHQFIDELQLSLIDVNNEISTRYFPPE